MITKAGIYPDHLTKIIINSTIKTLNLMGIQKLEVSSEPPKIEGKKIGMVLFMGQDMSGIFSVQLSDELLLQSFPLSKKDANPTQLEDWLGELVNRIMGVIKTEVTIYDVEIDISVPKIVELSDLREAEQTMAPFVEFHFIAKKGHLHAFFCAELNDELDFSKAPKPSNIIGDSGTAHVF